jgi:hypothetical protein
VSDTPIAEIVYVPQASRLYEKLILPTAQQTGIGAAVVAAGGQPIGTAPWTSVQSAVTGQRLDADLTSGKTLLILDGLGVSGRERADQMLLDRLRGAPTRAATSASVRRMILVPVEGAGRAWLQRIGDRIVDHDSRPRRM